MLWREAARQTEGVPCLPALHGVRGWRIGPDLWPGQWWFVHQRFHGRQVTHASQSERFDLTRCREAIGGGGCVSNRVWCAVRCMPRGPHRRAHRRVGARISRHARHVVEQVCGRTRLARRGPRVTGGGAASMTSSTTGSGMGSGLGSGAGATGSTSTMTSGSGSGAFQAGSQALPGAKNRVHVESAQALRLRSSLASAATSSTGIGAPYREKRAISAVVRICSSIWSSGPRHVRDRGRARQRKRKQPLPGQA